VATKRIIGRGYEGFVTGGPREPSERAVIVKHDHYVDIVVYHAASGTAERLAVRSGPDGDHDCPGQSVVHPLVQRRSEGGDDDHGAAEDCRNGG
jgi:hypothetical protein